MLIQSIYFSLPKFILAAVLCLPVLFKKEKKVSLAFIFLGAVFFYNFILIAGSRLQPQSLYYNWSGKILAILFVLTVIYLFKRKNNAFYFGLTFKQKAGSVKPVLYVVSAYIILQMLYLIIFAGENSFSLEAHLYQLTLPGIGEEIAYRGLFLGLLNEIFPNKKTIFGAKIGYGALVVSLIFVHGIDFNFYNGAFDIAINWFSAIISFYFAIVVIWMRERTGSVLIPILFHNLTNELIITVLSLK